MSHDSGFDAQRFYLGKVCKYGHDWNGTGHSLRRRKKATCLDCESSRVRDKEEVRLRKRRHYEQNRDRILAVNAVYKEAHKEECRALTKRWSEQNKEAVFVVRRAWREKHKERLIQERKAYRAANPERCRQADAAKYIRCREKRRAQSKLYRQTERGRTLERMARHRKRAKLRNASTHAPTFDEIAALREKCNHQCVYCGATESLSLDHFIPLRFGGSHCIGNLLIACTSCNSSKHTSDPYEWFQTRPTFSQKQWKAILKLLRKTQETYAQIPLL